MPLAVPPLTFGRTDKGEEYLTRDHVTRLIDDLQRAHAGAVKEISSAHTGEAAKLEAALKAAQKDAAKASDLERDLSTLRGQVERRDAAAELLGLTDPTEIEDLHSVYSSRTAGMEPDKRPSFRDQIAAWAESPDEAPGLIRPLLQQPAGQQAAGAGQQQVHGQQTQQQPPRVQVQTGGGRTQAGPAAGRMTVDTLIQGQAAGRSASDMYAAWRSEHGLPAEPAAR